VKNITVVVSPLQASALAVIAAKSTITFGNLVNTLWNYQNSSVDQSERKKMMGILTAALEPFLGPPSRVIPGVLLVCGRL
jgi:hypothetical protein